VREVIQSAIENKRKTYTEFPHLSPLPKGERLGEGVFSPYGKADSAYTKIKP
jgi:hypothetical protein